MNGEGEDEDFRDEDDWEDNISLPLHSMMGVLGVTFVLAVRICNGKSQE